MSPFQAVRVTAGQVLSRTRPAATLEAHRRSVLPIRSAIQHDLSEQAMCLATWARGEEQLIGLSGVPVAEPQAPQAFDGDRLAVGLAQLAQVRAGDRVVGVNVAVAEVAVPVNPAAGVLQQNCVLGSLDEPDG
jgi:hypothetical protein